MLSLVSDLIAAVYVLVPIAGFCRAAAAPRRKRRAQLRGFWLTCCGGMIFSALICTALAWSQGGRPMLGQVALGAYYASSMLLILQLFDFVLWRSVIALFRLSPVYDTWLYGLRAGLGMLLRCAVLFALGLPYLIAAALVYRPHVAFNQNPRTLLDRDFQPVTFPASDGTHLAGWWIPAPVDVASAGADHTVILCPGWNASQATQLFVTARLIEAGYNVLSFDFRGTGQSGGQFASFGVAERRDVLGAVRWLYTTHPHATHRIDGLGIDTGGAALLAAAADPNPDGQRIDAVAVYGTFDTLPDQLDRMSKRYLPPPLGWLLRHVGLPIASFHTGVSLTADSPVQNVQALWPHPLLIIQGTTDGIVPIDAGRALYDAASQPKDAYWVQHANAWQTIHDGGASRAVVHFFATAREML